MVLLANTHFFSNSMLLNVAVAVRPRGRAAREAKAAAAESGMAEAVSSCLQ